MRQVRRDDEHFAGVDELGGAVVEVKAQGTLEDEGDLLIGMRVPGDDASFGKGDTTEHGLAAGDELPCEEGSDLFDFDFAPTVEGCGGCCSRHEEEPFRNR